MTPLTIPKARNRIEVDAQSLRDQILTMHNIEEDLSDSTIDRVLGIPPYTLREDLSLQDLEKRYGHEQYVYQGTPYNYIRLLLSLVGINQHDVVYDLGSGYGRFVLYGATVTDATFRGVEIVPERIAYSEAIRRRLGLTNVRLLLGNVLNHSWNDGTVFFLFNPFTDATMRRVMERLKSIASERTITILTWGGGGTNQLLRANWLRSIQFEQDMHTPYNRLSVLQSNNGRFGSGKSLEPVVKVF